MGVYGLKLNCKNSTAYKGFILNRNRITSQCLTVPPHSVAKFKCLRCNCNLRCYVILKSVSSALGISLAICVLDFKSYFKDKLGTTHNLIVLLLFVTNGQTSSLLILTRCEAALSET